MIKEGVRNMNTVKKIICKVLIFPLYQYDHYNLCRPLAVGAVFRRLKPIRKFCLAAWDFRRLLTLTTMPAR